ncbi:hypothetical protein IU487_34275 [Nocardia puris]|uniref:hypothetical protein n=1 Tax=Nocardia puris TaxID=208602 RepID=UPI001894FABA|nr:hypothetical protein [Nocardia puris]MBF6216067.1 hypothetical protein [Nocardia puris]
MTLAHPAIKTIEDVMRGADPPRVVFCDWHGVLCRKPFWHSITDNPGHPLHAVLNRELDRLFTTGNREGREWMRGKRSSRDILTNLAAAHPGPDIDQLLTQLAHDIAHMPVYQPLLQALRGARSDAAIVLATDNIDAFTSAFQAITSGHNEQLSGQATLGGAATVFDDIISSSDTGVLKSEDPAAFFGSWLTTAGRSFSEALLIDDRADNCAAFERCGGAAIEWTQYRLEELSV